MANQIREPGWNKIRRLSDRLILAIEFNKKTNAPDTRGVSLILFGKISTND